VYENTLNDEGSKMRELSFDEVEDVCGGYSWEPVLETANVFFDFTDTVLEIEGSDFEGFVIIPNWWNGELEF